MSIKNFLNKGLMFAVENGDCKAVLKDVPDERVDAFLIDPPAGIRFSGKHWDSSSGGRSAWTYKMSVLFDEHRRVLKAGRLAWIWSFPRTSHWTGVAIEDSGLEIVDCFFHIFSHRRPSSPHLPKAACEMWWLVRRPGPGRSLVQPDIGSCVIPATQRSKGPLKVSRGRWATSVIFTHSEPSGTKCGSDCPINQLDQMSGILHSGSGARVSETTRGYQGHAYGMHCRPKGTACVSYGDSGGASRFFSVLQDGPPFFYANRASPKERNEGLPSSMTNEGVAVKPQALLRHLLKLIRIPPGGIVLDGFAGTGSTGIACAGMSLRFIGIEQNEKDAAVALKRVSHAYTHPHPS